MSRSYTCLYYHFVFSTRDRQPTITPAVRPELHRYLGGLVKAEGGLALEVGGTDDHVHIVAKLSQNRAVADVMRVVKTNSSKWAHEAFPNAVPIWWQGGYGAFTVSESALATVRDYVRNQEEHHRTVSFQEEFLALLVQHGCEFDERYVWE